MTIKLHPKVQDYLSRIKEAANLEQRLLQGTEWRIKWLSKREKSKVAKADIVVLGHNWFEMTLRCLRSVYYLSAGIRIIYVDNGSSEEVPDEIVSLCDQVIRLKENQGFARGMNAGIQATRPDADVVILNNDCEVTAGWLEEMQKTAQGEKVGIVSPRTENCCIRAVCGDDCGDIDLPWIPAVCWLIKRSTIEKVGIFDPAYEMGWLEDCDYCLQVRQAGLECWLSSKAFVRHAGSVTSKSLDLAEARKRNEAYFDTKWGRKR